MHKVFIPFKDYTSVGGHVTFMKNLKKHLERKYYDFTENEYESKNIFFPIEYKLDYLKFIKKSGGKIIQRLDGVFYPSLHSQKELEYNEIIKDVYFNYTDYIVYQSKYSQRQCEHIFGPNPKPSSLIVNGVNKDIFFPNKKRKVSTKKLKFITTGNFREEHMLAPLIKAFDLVKDSMEFELRIVGPIKEELNKYLDKPYINYRGVKSIEEMAEELRESDVFIYSFLNPACPNSVLEAISTALPIIGFDTGSMSELAFFSKELLAQTNDEIIHVIEDLKPEKLAEKINYFTENVEKYSELALEHSNLYSMDDCGDKYVKVFDEVYKINFIERFLMSNI